MFINPRSHPASRLEPRPDGPRDPELQRSAGPQGRPNYMLRWVTAIAASPSSSGTWYSSLPNWAARPSRMQPKEHLLWWCADASSPDCQAPARSGTTFAAPASIPSAHRPAVGNT